MTSRRSERYEKYKPCNPDLMASIGRNNFCTQYGGVVPSPGSYVSGYNANTAKPGFGSFSTGLKYSSSSPSSARDVHRSFSRDRPARLHNISGSSSGEYSHCQSAPTSPRDKTAGIIKRSLRKEYSMPSETRSPTSGTESTSSPTRSYFPSTSYSVSPSSKTMQSFNDRHTTQYYLGRDADRDRNHRVTFNDSRVYTSRDYSPTSVSYLSSTHRGPPIRRAEPDTSRLQQQQRHSPRGQQRRLGIGACSSPVMGRRCRSPPPISHLDSDSSDAESPVLQRRKAAYYSKSKRSLASVLSRVSFVCWDLIRCRRRRGSRRYVRRTHGGAYISHLSDHCNSKLVWDGKCI